VASLSLGTLSWKARLGAFLALSIAGAGAFYYVLDMPAQQQIVLLERDVAAIRGRIDKGRETARQLPQFRAEVAELQARLDGLRPVLPDEKDAADLLRRVHTLAVQSNLTIRGFKPQAITMREMHAEWPISLEIEGTYHNLGAFLDRVSKFPRIINVSGLDIAGKPNAQSTIAVTCTATTFVLIDSPREDAATPQGAAASKAPKKSV
jgi:type IV pilus assembly protein PilO